MPQARPVLNRKSLSRPSATPDSFDATLPADPPTSAQARVLAGTETLTRPLRPPAGRAATGSEAPADSRSANGAPSPAGRRTPGQAQSADAPGASDALPRWARRVVIAGVLLAVGMPASVLLSRSMLVQAVLTEENTSKADMVCTAGDGRARNGSSVGGWLFGGSYFQCSEWETRDARLQRERAQYEANYAARERARLGLGN